MIDLAKWNHVSNNGYAVATRIAIVYGWQDVHAATGRVHNTTKRVAFGKPTEHCRVAQFYDVGDSVDAQNEFMQWLSRSPDWKDIHAEQTTSLMTWAESSPGIWEGEKAFLSLGLHIRTETRGTALLHAMCRMKGVDFDELAFRRIPILSRSKGQS